MDSKIQTPTGMEDILEEEWVFYEMIEKKAKEILKFHNFERIETPILEKKELFLAGIGERSEVIQKEMFTLKTEGETELSLRPEGTVPICRAYIQRGMKEKSQPVKLWYFGPFFRHERPQAGRYRQFWQLGLEILGSKDPVLDAEVIQIFYQILKELKIEDILIHVNCLGDKNCRPYYKKSLTQYFKNKEKSLCKDCQRRLKENVLRILDCKDEKCQRIVSGAPQILDYLCEECKKFFEEFLEYLESISIPYQLNPYLVRGLDYYTKTVFEIFETSEKKLALAGGGRYDDLIEILSKQSVPGTGGAMGVERVIEILKKKIKIPKEKKFLYLACLGKNAKAKALEILEILRKEKIECYFGLGKESLKSQLKLAEKFKVKFCLILGQKEVLENSIILKDMETGLQSTMKIEEAIKKLKQLIKKIQKT
jgi:histidyl-tRNA synthetase